MMRRKESQRARSARLRTSIAFTRLLERQRAGTTSESFPVKPHELLLLDKLNLDPEDLLLVQEAVLDALTEFDGSLFHIHMIGASIQAVLTSLLRPERGRSKGEWQVIVGTTFSGITVCRKRAVFRDRKSLLTVACIYV
jgi:hypothetical protein